jgi:ribonuclease T2
MTKLLLLLAGIVSLPAYAELKVHIIDVGQAASALVELDHAAILIDAGGEDTVDDRDAKSIRAALTAFFKRRTDLNNTLDAVIISHPHIDHTMNLMVVMKEFKVRQLIDNGDTKNASGMPQLKEARQFAADNHIPNVAINDSAIPDGGKPLTLSGAGNAEILLLSGLRNCPNPNNDSIAVRIKDGNASVLFAGDAEEEDDSGPCQTEPQLQHLQKRFGSTGLLEARLYHSTHHGSANGVLDPLMEKVHPDASVISAGRLAAKNRKPGDFHAWQFGHPRKVAIDSLTAHTSGSRPSKQISFMTAAKGTPQTGKMTKAVYCTCWDGNVDITFATDGTPKVKPLGTLHASAEPAAAPTARLAVAANAFVDEAAPAKKKSPAKAGPACSIKPADVFAPKVKSTGPANEKSTDYYMLSLSWSPQFCKTNGSSAANKFQCKENSFGFVVHGLWAQTAGETDGQNEPRNCKPNTAISTATLRQHLCTVPGIQLMQDEWSKHGTCAFDAPEDFLNKIETLKGALHLPDLNALAKSKGAALKASDVTTAFTSANPGLTAGGVQLLLQGKNLQEVHVCYDKSFGFRKCDTSSSVSGTTKISIVRGP